MAQKVLKKKKNAPLDPNRDATRALAVVRMLAGFIHQFRTPLHISRSSTESLREHAGLPPELKPHLDLLDRSLVRLQTNVQALLQYARGEEPEWTVGSVNDPINALCVYLKEESLRRQIILDRRQDASLPPIRMQEPLLQEALLNLAVNGMEAMTKGGTLKLTTEKSADGKTVRVTVIDTGVGMSPDRLKQIGRFASTGKSGGMGLGTYFALEILKKHQAQTRWQSRPGQGTTVTITFKAIPSRPERLKAALHSSLKKLQNKLKKLTQP